MEIKDINLFETSKAIGENGLLIKYINNPDEYLCHLAVTNKPESILYIANPSDNITQLALELEPMVIKYIPTDRIDLTKGYMINNQYLSLSQVKNQTSEIVSIVISNKFKSDIFDSEDIKKELSYINPDVDFNICDIDRIMHSTASTFKIAMFIKFLIDNDLFNKSANHIVYNFRIINVSLIFDKLLRFYKDDNECIPLDTLYTIINHLRRIRFNKIDVIFDIISTYNKYIDLINIEHDGTIEGDFIEMYFVMGRFKLPCIEYHDETVIYFMTHYLDLNILKRDTCYKNLFRSVSYDYMKDFLTRNQDTRCVLSARKHALAHGWQIEYFEHLITVEEFLHAILTTDIRLVDELSKLNILEKYFNISHKESNRLIELFRGAWFDSKPLFYYNKSIYYKFKFRKEIREMLKIHPKIKK